MDVHNKKKMVHGCPFLSNGDEYSEEEGIVGYIQCRRTKRSSWMILGRQ